MFQISEILFDLNIDTKCYILKIYKYTLRHFLNITTTLSLTKFFILLWKEVFRWLELYSEEKYIFKSKTTEQSENYCVICYPNTEFCV